MAINFGERVGKAWELGKLGGYTGESMTEIVGMMTSRWCSKHLIGRITRGIQEAYILATCRTGYPFDSDASTGIVSLGRSDQIAYEFFFYVLEVAYLVFSGSSCCFMSIHFALRNHY